MTEDILEETVNREVLIGIAGAAGGLLAGGALGYFLARRNLEVKYAKFADQEIAEMREHYRESKAIAAIPKPDLQDVVEELGYVEPKQEEAPPIVIEAETTNIFVNAEPESEWVWADELRQRSEGAPYIIHKDEFTQNEREYTQSTLTYFEEDDVLCDERDTPIDDREEMIGLDLFERFGHGSGDANILFVRNPIREIDIEIIKSSGSYAEEVHGLKHYESYGRSARVKRGYDDDEIT